MTVLSITINDPSSAFASKAAEVQYLKRVLETFLIEIGRGQGTVTSGSITGQSALGVASRPIGVTLH
jgi:hypothetical protein